MILLTLAVSQSAMAQSVSKVELFGGYSHLWEHKKHVHGWSASFGFNANQWLTLVGIVTVNYLPDEPELTGCATPPLTVVQYGFYLGRRFSSRRGKNTTL